LLWHRETPLREIQSLGGHARDDYRVVPRRRITRIVHTGFCASTANSCKKHFLEQQKVVHATMRLQFSFVKITGGTKVTEGWVSLA
jgi:hypothetical protein